MTPPRLSPIPHLIAILMCIACTLTIAQTSTGEPIAPDLTEMEIDPITIDSIGLSLNLPKNAQAETVRIGNSTSTGIALPADLGTIIVKEQRTSNPDLTSLEAAQSIRDQLLKTPGSELVSEQPSLRAGIWTGHRIYIKVRGRTQAAPPVYRGVTIFSHKPNTFLVFDYTIEASEERFEIGRVMYETIVTSMDLQEMSSETLKRAAGFSSMQSLLNQLTIEDYDAVLTGKKGERWERLYTPAASGDEMDATEHGYRRVRTWSGYKGELGTKERDKWNAEDRKLGYLVQIDSMALDSGMRIDSRAIFYMSLDGEEEVWTIKMTLKDETQKKGTKASEPRISSVTGARIGGKLSITSVDGKAAPSTVSPFIPEEGYITQVQSYLIGPLIAHKKLQGDFASYAYNPITNTVTLRWDIAEQPAQSPGLWNITTKSSPDSPPSTAQFNARGELMRVRLSNKRMWEPITLDRLLSLWKRKGLPLQ